MKHPILFFVFFALAILCFCPPAEGKGKLGAWFKEDNLDFKIRIPKDWKEIDYPADYPNLIGLWRGPRMEVNLKKLGSYGFSSDFKILWFETEPMNPVTPSGNDEEKEAPEDEIDEVERAKRLAKRLGQQKARNLDQWLNNYSQLRGMRIDSKKDSKLGERPAVEYEILSKTDIGVDYVHYALSVKVSENYDVAVMYSVVEPEYKKWRSFFKKCTKTLDIDWPDLPDPKKSSRSRKSGRKSKTEPAGPVEFTDTLITHHGKVVEGKIREEGEGYLIQWDQASITVPATLVKQVEYGDPTRYMPETEEDKENVAKGFVKYKGRWISKSRYDTEVRREQEKQEARIARMKEHSDPANPWREERSRFILETTTSEELMNHYADLIDVLFTTYERTLGVKVSSTARKKKPTIRVFKDAQEYHNFSQNPSSAGYFNWADNSLNLYHNFEDPGLSEKTLLHEGTHLLNFLSNTAFTRRPHWIEEGAAEYFGSSKRIIDSKGRIKLEPGQILGNRLLLVNDRIETGEVRELRGALAARSYHYEDYAYWWCFFHFCMNHKKYSKKFLTFYRNLYALKNVEKRTMGSYFMVTPEDSVQYMEKSLGIRDWVRVQAEWEEFVVESVSKVGGFGWFVLGRDLYNEAYYSQFRKTDGLDKPERKEIYEETLKEALASLDRAIGEKEYHKADAYYYRHLVFKSQKETDKALEDIEKALAFDPLKGSYYYSRAALRYKKGKKDEAENDMRIAIALDPMNIKFPVILAEMAAGVFMDVPMM
ncbi:MAG: tetratricopeptide repeat protein [Planctomycetota bacterium]|jgi:hypothetical protein